MRFQFRTGARELDGFSMRFRGACGEHTFDIRMAGRVRRRRLPHPRARRPPVVAEGLRRAEPLHRHRPACAKTGQVLAERTERIGLRRLVVDRTLTRRQALGVRSPPSAPARVDIAPDPASHFVFYVNGEPIMVKGANWVPLDAFHSRDAERV